MPIFQDPDRQRFYDLWSDDHTEHERGDHKSSWADHHDGSWGFNDSKRDVGAPVDRRTPDLQLPRLHTGDRTELIQYIKSADTSTWGQGPLSGDTYPPHVSDEHLRMEGISAQGEMPIDEYRPSGTQEELGSPAEIQRPRSALHSGDFREGTGQLHGQEPSQPSPAEPSAGSHLPQLGSSPTTPWYSPPAFQSPLRKQQLSTQSRAPWAATGGRSRAPSLGSFSSSYVLKAPTSPLVHQANNTDLDFSPRADIGNLSDSMEKANRRRTLPPESFRYLQPSFSGVNSFHGTNPFDERADPFSCQAHHPQRNPSSTYSLQLASSVHTPALRLRRPSLTSESSPKCHAPMVGSYEECILRGRMSMNPSKPLDFTAQIGVLGKGKCKANLKCPPHVSIPFPAVFYSYPTSGRGRSISDDNPSPYVGLIDLDSSLPKDDPSINRRRKLHHDPVNAHDDAVTESAAPPRHNESEILRRREKRNRRAESPKCPPGGCYRIPQQGQLQIIIKNPNKTAVKLFLVPYDLSDMEPGTKTFIRQRSYSAGPIIDMPLTARKNFGTDRPEASLNASEDPKDKPILRYLIHLNICSPSRGRFYLHSSVRVVFANRVPDGKEKLRNEIQHPDPRYTPYKPTREANVSHMGQKVVAEKAFRRNVGQGLMQEFISPDYERSREHFSTVQAKSFAVPSMDGNGSVAAHPEDRAYFTQRVPHSFQPNRSLKQGPWEDSGLYKSINTESVKNDADETEMYNKLSKGDIGYGGSPFGSFAGSEPGESLLAKRLRGLDVQRHDSAGSR